MIIDNKSQEKKDLEFYTNKETFLGKPINEIEDNLFYSIKYRSYYYAFDIRELKQILYHNHINPYNNEPFNKNVIKQINRILFRLKNKNTNTEIIKYIPDQCIASAKIATIFNKLSEYSVYPNMKQFLKFRVIDYVYYIQDIRVNSIIGECIHPIKYKKLMEIYRKYQYQQNLKESHTYKKKLRIVAQDIVLTIIGDILDIDDDHRTTRALAITEQINYNYEQETNSNDNIQSSFSVMNPLSQSPPPPSRHSTQRLHNSNTIGYPPFINRDSISTLSSLLRTRSMLVHRNNLNETYSSQRTNTFSPPPRRLSILRRRLHRNFNTPPPISSISINNDIEQGNNVNSEQIQQNTIEMTITPIVSIPSQTDESSNILNYAIHNLENLSDIEISDFDISSGEDIPSDRDIP